MRWLSGLLLGILLGLGCGKTVYRSHEGHYCSSTENDDPFFECSPSYDLICINTYAEQVNTTGGEEPRFQEIYLCRLACNAGERCQNLTDVCCKGPISGRNYGKTHACVPAGQCQKEQDQVDAGMDRPRDTATDNPIDVDARTADAPASVDAADAPGDAPAMPGLEAGSPDASPADAPTGGDSA
jgi:hypothetical protein